MNVSFWSELVFLLSSAAFKSFKILNSILVNPESFLEEHVTFIHLLLPLSAQITLWAP